MNITFEGRSVIVTGAAHGFGRAMAQAFVARGARVAALDVNAEGLAETQRLCGPACETAVVDVGILGALVLCRAGMRDPAAWRLQAELHRRAQRHPRAR